MNALTQSLGVGPFRMPVAYEPEPAPLDANGTARLTKAAARRLISGAVLIASPTMRAGPMPLDAMENTKQSSGLQGILINERPRLIRFLQARGAGDEAEDLLQELWQRVSASPGHPIADPLSYLFRAAENLMRDHRRSQFSRQRRQFDWHEITMREGDEPGGERVLIARERLREVERRIEELGPRVARVFRSYRLEGQNQARIASELGISLSSVEKDLQKAYRCLAAIKATFDAD
jgi:RNA polymerase sigma factor (sigma-70 family)